MAVKYIDSAATGSNNGTSWANAYTTFQTAAGSDAAGDIFYVKSTHSESTAGAVSLSWAGTQASPTRIICVSDSNEPPTTIATGAVVAVTGANNLAVVSAGYVYIYGVRFKAGDSTNAANVTVSGTQTVLESCAIELGGNNSGSTFSGPSTAHLVALNCTFKSANSGSRVNPGVVSAFYGCSIESGGTPGAPFFANTSANARFRVAGFDFTNLSSSADLSDATANRCFIDFIDCKLPSSWSGSPCGTPTAGSIVTLANSDSADTQYRLQRKTQFGEVVHETTIKRTGGASNGTTGLAWKMVSNADAEWNHQTLDSPEIVKWNETTGSSVTATVEFVHDSVTNMTDKEIWLEVMYLGTSGVPLGLFITDAAANYLSSAADQTDSSETWTTTGLTNPNTQKLSVSFTPQEKGFVHAVVKVAAASKTVYVDPVLTLA